MERVRLGFLYRNGVMWYYEPATGRVLTIDIDDEDTPKFEYKPYETLTEYEKTELAKRIANTLHINTLLNSSRNQFVRHF